MAITCPNGHVNDEGNRFCDQCGAPLTGTPSVTSAAPSESQPPVTSTGSIVCATCGQENLPGTAFCENCGAQLPLPAPAPTIETEPASTASTVSTGGTTCPNCGTVNEAGNVFCEQCGASLAGTSATAAAPMGSDQSQPQPSTVSGGEEQATPATSGVDLSPSVDTGTATPPVDASAAVEPPVATPGAQSQPATAETQPPPEEEPVVVTDSTADVAVAPEASIDTADAGTASPSTVVGQVSEGTAAPQATAASSTAGVQATEEAQVCSNCGAALPPGAKFCMECGTKVEQAPQMVRPTHCQNCGAELPANARFCLECGTKVELVPATSAGQAATPTMAEAASPTYQQQAAESAPIPAPAAPPSSNVNVYESEPAPTVAAPSGTDGTSAATPAETPPPAPVQTPDVQAPAQVATPTAASGGPRLTGPNNTTISLPPKGELVIGREDPISGIHPDVDLTPHGGEAGGVSRRHAILNQDNGQWTVTDLDSTNYTRVDGNRIAANSPVPIYDGTRLQFGRIEFVFHSQ